MRPMSHDRPETDPPRARPYKALLEALTRHDDLARLFHDLAQRLRKVVEFDFISVMLYDPADDVMRLHVMESEQPAGIISGEGLGGPRGWTKKG
jgi:formate hydrogenlyase transcriptional activator